MVKRYYVITKGLEVGVFFDHWINIAHLVKDRPGAVWQGATSEREAQELFEQASLNGYVRILPDDRQRSPKSPSKSSTQRTLSSPSTDRTQQLPPRRTSAPRVAGFHSEGHVSYNTPRFVPSWINSRESNTGNSNASARTTGSNDRSSASGRTKQSKPLSRTQSEPHQQTQNSDFIRGGHPSSRSSASFYRHGNPTPPVSPVTSHSTGTRVARVESPSWLVSYPDDDEEEAFITPPLSPVFSPGISSSKLLGLSKSEPVSTFFANRELREPATGRFMSYDGSRDTNGKDFVLSVRSPKPEKLHTRFSFSPQVQESSSISIDGGFRNRGGKLKQKDEQAVGTSTSRRSTGAQGRPEADVESLFDLLETVDILVKDLRTNVISPSVLTGDGLLHLDYVENSLHDLKLSAAASFSNNRNEFAGTISPRSSSNDNLPQPLPSLNPSALSSPLEPGISSNPASGDTSYQSPLLFKAGHCSGRSPTHKNISYLDSTSPCKSCNGSGLAADDGPSPDKPRFVEPVHSPKTAQDPRSPLTGSNDLGPPVSKTSCRPSPTMMPGTLRAIPGPLFASSVGRG